MEEKKQTKDIFSALWQYNLLAIFIEIVLIVIKRTSLPEKIPLFYSRPWGEEQLADRNLIFAFPVFSLVFLILSSQISKIFVKGKDSFLPALINGGALLFTVLGLITLFKIIFLIT
ncbi:hypothetical protein COT64_00550 [Candidatus Shapirobacteria bacterium CG09_land_8_20_14_0_10_39_12]|uniref:DUF1648 domain-containing protein n=1 Tax=Candidatus Shapirobacteria bacterium CG09_land_8_20_14_0_10_39_12 TaxID=1974885 RepID=A0A2H0WQA0_9BACT|nr:MAG: hypothetical protein COT64_00550 [Candidatus Shapirobacteria bacterium CG09_land_8_20_14_0_10_39_12]